ncbi:MAG: hypothetical protein ABI134_14090 [Byssovorax sp.]
MIQRAVVAYATRVCATVEDDDATTIEAARDALAAIEKMRLTASNKRGSSAEAELPAAPPAVPVVLVAEATDATKPDEK